MAKSYSKFTFEDLQALGIEVVIKSFMSNIKSVKPSNWLKQTLDVNLKLPLSSEKAKCEHIIVPILTEMVVQNNKSFTYFSGYNFEVDKTLGLNGRCDFILSMKPDSPIISVPVFSIVEAKNDNLDVGIPQCVAEMYAAQLFNKKHNNAIKTIYGAVSFGLAWQFLCLHDKQAWLDTEIYYISDLPKVLGALQYLIDLSSSNG